jgi:hypothetical protein
VSFSILWGWFVPGEVSEHFQDFRHAFHRSDALHGDDVAAVYLTKPRRFGGAATTEGGGYVAGGMEGEFHEIGRCRRGKCGSVVFRADAILSETRP